MTSAIGRAMPNICRACRCEEKKRDLRIRDRNLFAARTNLMLAADATNIAERKAWRRLAAESVQFAKTAHRRAIKL